MIIRRTIAIIAVISWYSAMMQAQDIVIHVPVSQPRLLEVDAGQDRTAEDPGQILLGEDMQVAGGTPGYTYFWTDPDNQGYEGETLSGISFGQYLLKVTDRENCTAVDSVSIFNATSVRPDHAYGQVEFFPNPSSGIIYFDATGFEGMIRLEVIDLSGRTVHQDQVPNPGNGRIRSMNLDQIPEGTYLIRLLDSTNSRMGQIHIN